MNAIPWYKSPQQIGLVTTAISALIAIFPKLGQELGWTSPSDVTNGVTQVFGVIAVIAPLVGALVRARSKIQPLTLTQSAADVHPNTLANVQAKVNSQAVKALTFFAVLVLVCVASGLSACSSLGIAPAQTLYQKLAYVEGAVIAVQQSVVTALQAKQITSTEGTNINNMALSVLAIVASARGLEGTNVASATNDLTLAQAALTSLQSYLTTAGVK